MVDYKKQGKANRKSGAAFELKVREKLESEGWFVTKWGNNIDITSEKIVKAKVMFNPFRKAMTLGTGFPDFLCFKPEPNEYYEGDGFLYRVKFVESKKNGYLTQEEKKKIEILTRITGCAVEVVKDEKEN